jgi:hypothetical protein
MNKKIKNGNLATGDLGMIDNSNQNLLLDPPASASILLVNAKWYLKYKNVHWWQERSDPAFIKDRNIKNYCC